MHSIHDLLIFLPVEHDEPISRRGPGRRLSGVLKVEVGQVADALLLAPVDRLDDFLLISWA